MKNGDRALQGQSDLRFNIVAEETRRFREIVKGMTQKEFADSLDVAPIFVSRVETGYYKFWKHYKQMVDAIEAVYNHKIDIEARESQPGSFQNIVELQSQILSKIGALAADTGLTPQERENRLQLIFNMLNGL